MTAKIVIRVFPRRTSLTPLDDGAFVGMPTLDRPEADEVHVSCTFTWDIARAEYLARAWGQYYPVVRLGGPAFNSTVNGFIPGQYIKAGVTFTSRGCNHRCPWCLVPEREGRLKPVKHFPDGYIIQDNNFLQCPPSHRERVYVMLRKQRRAAVFSGGLQSSLITDAVAEELRSIRIREVFLACDSLAAIKPLHRATKRLAWLGRNKLRCYVLLAYGNETIREAEEHLLQVWAAGCLPFAQLYQPPDHWIDYPSEWRHLARTWSRPAATKSVMKVVRQGDDALRRRKSYEHFTDAGRNGKRFRTGRYG